MRRSRVSAREGYALWAETWDATPSPIVALEASRAAAVDCAALHPRRAIDVGLRHRPLDGASVRHRRGCFARDARDARRRSPGCAAGLRWPMPPRCPSRAAAADLVLCALTLGHIRDHGAAMREFARILAPGGTLLLTDFHPAAAAHGWRRTFRRDGQRLRTGEPSVHGRPTSRCGRGPGACRVRGGDDRRAGARALRYRRQARAVRGGLPHAGGAADALGTTRHEYRAPSDSGSDLDSATSCMPGLINAHDHLEFNLFPRLGRGPYPNAGEWARDIYHPDRSPIREQLRVPKAGAPVVGRAQESAERRDHGLPSQSLRA